MTLQIVAPTNKNNRSSYTDAMEFRLKKSLARFIVSEKRSNVFSMAFPLDHSSLETVRDTIYASINFCADSLKIPSGSLVFNLTPTASKRSTGRYSNKKVVQGVQQILLTIEFKQVLLISDYVLPSKPKGSVIEATCEDYKALIKRWAINKHKRNWFCNTEKPSTPAYYSNATNSSKQLVIDNLTKALDSLELSNIPFEVVRRNTVREEWCAIIDFSSFS